MNSYGRALGSARRPTVGIVGLGYWGPNRLRVLVENERVDVRYICELDAARLARYAKRYPSVKATFAFSELLEDDDLDAIIIATPIFTHFELASRSIEAGKHTFVEKPLAESGSRAGALIELAQEHNVVLRCGHTFLFSPAVKAVKEIISRGELGEICFISSSRVNLGIHQQDVSVIWDLAPHDVSMLLFWLEEVPAWISAVGRDSVVKGVADVAFVDLGFPSGILANVELSWLAPSKLRRTVIVGREKMILYDDTSKEPVRVFDQGVVFQEPETFGEYQLAYRTGDIVSPKLEGGEPIAKELDSFFDDIQEGDTGPEQLLIARNVVAVIEAAESSLAHGGAQREVSPLVLAPEAG